MIKLKPPLKGKLTSLYTDKGIITQLFGEHPENYKQFGLIGHNGLDMYSRHGDNVYASHDGIIVSVRYNDGGYGWNVRIVSDKIDGKYIYTIYGHLSKALVKEGDKVKAGGLIGLEGNTGYVLGVYDGTHLHLGLYFLADPQSNTYQISFPNGKSFTMLNYNNGYKGAVDPLPYLLNNMLKIIGDKSTNKQYLIGIDGKGTWIYNLAILEWFHKKGIIDKNQVEWKDKISEIELDGETIALIK